MNAPHWSSALVLRLVLLSAAVADQGEARRKSVTTRPLVRLNHNERSHLGQGLSERRFSGRLARGVLAACLVCIDISASSMLTSTGSVWVISSIYGILKKTWVVIGCALPRLLSFPDRSILVVPPSTLQIEGIDVLYHATGTTLSQ